MNTDKPRMGFAEARHKRILIAGVLALILVGAVHLVLVLDWNSLVQFPDLSVNQLNPSSTTRGAGSS